MRKVSIVMWLGVLVIGVIVTWLANHFGQWYFTFLIAFIIGLWRRRGFSAWSAALLVGVLGWGLPLLIQSMTTPIGKASSVITGIMGFGSAAWPALTLTVAVGLLLAVAGVWLGTAIRSWGTSAVR